MQVAELMRAPLSVRADLPAADADRLARGRRLHHVLVSTQDYLLGTVCICELRAAPERAAVRECVRRPAIAIGVRMRVERAAEIMQERQVSCLPVVEGDRVMGLITREDLVRAGIELGGGLVGVT